MKLNLEKDFLMLPGDAAVIKKKLRLDYYLIN